MYGCKPFNTSQICVKEEVNGYEISLAFDDSCHTMKKLERGDIRVYRISDDKDVTEYIQNYTIPATIENLIVVYAWCNSH